jgi:dual specificity phosphatase 12
MLGPAFSQVDGKLACPKCTVRLGSYTWSGMQCSCGAWVAPAFQVVKSKVDEVKAR